uniref:Uncharacterized protein n=1 Tax=Melopsittacus undulatus TaxID=13146 RepID=A0A8C6J890_MELUD
MERVHPPQLPAAPCLGATASPAEGFRPCGPSGVCFPLCLRWQHLRGLLSPKSLMGAGKSRTLAPLVSPFPGLMGQELLPGPSVAGTKEGFSSLPCPGAPEGRPTGGSLPASGLGCLCPLGASRAESGRAAELLGLTLPLLFPLWVPFSLPGPLQSRGEGSGLSALLPQPKNMTVKESNRLLLPYSVSRKAGESPSDCKAKAPTSSSKAKPPSKPAVPTTPSPSAIKAAAKSAALQVTKQITQEEDDSDEELEPENYFSLSDRSEPGAVGADTYLYSGPGVPDDPPPGTEPEPHFQDAAANAPLEFKTGAGSSGAQHSWVPKPGEDYSSQAYSQFPAYGEPGAYYQDYYSTGYYQEGEPAQAAPQEMSSDSSFLDDEAFKRLQGKRNRGREEINFVDIKGDDQLSGAQQWLTKSLTEEKTMKSFSKRKGDQPTGQQRRKHQITYLIHQAKERELELKNTWSENKLSRRQTQAKYGF